MKKTVISLFFLGFISFKINAQVTTSQSSIIIDLSPELIDEAELKGITNDRIYVSFTMAADCKIFDFKIVRSAKLENFNLIVLKDEQKIIKQLKSVFQCNSIKEQKFQTPIFINIE